MILRRPGWIPAGTDCSTMVDVTDFYQTFCELAGIKLEPEALRDLDGVSLVPLMNNPGAALSRDAMCWLYPHYNQFTGPCATIRKGNMKLIKFYGGASQLFDLNDDIAESNDLAAQQPERVTQMHAELEQWLQDVGAWEMVRNPSYNPRKHSHGIYPEFDVEADGAELVHEWSFDEGTLEQWKALEKCTLSVRAGTLIVASTGYAASMENSVNLERGTFVLQAKMRERGIHKGASVLFWKDRAQKQYEPSRRIQFAAPHDDQEHLVSALFRVSKPADSIRFDPAMMAGTVEFDWIKIYKTNLP